MKPVTWMRWVLATLLFAAVLAPPQAQAQVPGRFYWKSLSGANGVPFIYNSLSGNASPFDPSQTVQLDAKIDATMALAGYAHTFTLAERSAMAAIIVPMGHLSAEGTIAGESAGQASSGFGDPMLEFDINLIGPKAQNTIPDVLRFEPGFSLDLLVDLALPIGEYDNSQPLNLGQNRWYGRIGAPIIWQFGPWVPGQRTTLEFLPVFWLFGENDDLVGQTLDTDPMFQLDAHLTRDFTEHFWGALDMVWYNGGGSTINDVEAGDLNNIGVGFTFGYAVNENLNLTVGYKSTVNDSEPTDLRMDGFMMTIVYGWHPTIEGMGRLKSE